MSIWLLYWLTRLDHVSGLVEPILIFTSTFVMLFLIVFLISTALTASYPNDDEPVRFKKMTATFLKIGIPLWFILSLINTLIPTNKELMLIGGGYYVTNIEGINKLPPNMIAAANTFIEEYIEPLKDDVKDTIKDTKDSIKSLKNKE